MSDGSPVSGWGGKPVKDAYKRSKAMRKAAKKDHGLGFHKHITPQAHMEPHHRKGFRGNSMASIPIMRLEERGFPDGLALLNERMKLLPEKKRIKLQPDMKYSLCDLLGRELAFMLIALDPNIDEINKLADPIPDIEKRLAAQRNGDDGE